MKKILSLFACLLVLISLTSTKISADGEQSADVLYQDDPVITFKDMNIVIVQTVKIGEKVNEPSHQTINGYTFIGWFNGDVLYDFNLPVMEHLTLVAKYQKNNSHTQDDTISAQEEAIKPAPKNDKKEDKTPEEEVEELVEQGKIINQTIKSENALNAFISFNANSLGLSAHDIEQIKAGNSLLVKLEATDITDSVSRQEKELAEDYVLNHEQTIGVYLDLQLKRKFASALETEWENIYETDGLVEIAVLIPKQIRQSNCIYSVYRINDGEIEIVHTGYPSDDWELKFKTNKFSTYVITYKEIVSPTPQPEPTNSNIALGLILGLLIGILLGWIFIIILFRRAFKIDDIKYKFDKDMTFEEWLKNEKYNKDKFYYNESTKRIEILKDDELRYIDDEELTLETKIKRGDHYKTKEINNGSDK